MAMNEAFRNVAEVDAEIVRLEAAIERADTDCSQSVLAQAELAAQLQQAFARIARAQVDGLAGQPQGTADALTRDTLPALRQRDARIATQRERLAALRARVATADAALAALKAGRDEAARRLQVLCDGVDATLERQTRYQPLLAAFHAADDAAHAAQRMAASAHEEHAAKAGAYEADRIFMYLFARRFGSTDYRAGALVRRVDGWLARLCGFEAASRDYALLVALPAHLDAHAAQTLAMAAAAADQLEQVRRPALLAAGVAALEAELQQQQTAFGAALLDGQLQQGEIDTLQAGLDALAAWSDPTGQAIIEKLATALAAESPGQIDQRVLATPTPEDDQALLEVRDLRQRITAAGEQYQRQQAQMGQDRSRLQRLAQARRDHLAEREAEARQYRVQASHARRAAYAPAPVSSWSSLLGGGGGGHRGGGSPAPSRAPASAGRGGGSSGSGAGNGFHTGGGF